MNLPITRLRVGGAAGLVPACTPRSSQAPQVGFLALTVRRTVVVVSLALVLLAGCEGGGGGDTSSVAPSAGCTAVAVPKPKQVHLSLPTERLNGPATATV